MSGGSDFWEGAAGSGSRPSVRTRSRAECRGEQDVRFGLMTLLPNVSLNVSLSAGIFFVSMFSFLSVLARNRRSLDSLFLSCFQATKSADPVP